MCNACFANSLYHHITRTKIFIVQEATKDRLCNSVVYFVPLEIYVAHLTGIRYPCYPMHSAKSREISATVDLRLGGLSAFNGGRAKPDWS